MDIDKERHDKHRKQVVLARWVFLIGLVFVVIPLVSYIAYDNHKSKKEFNAQYGEFIKLTGASTKPLPASSPYNEDKMLEAYLMSQNYVKEDLKAPSSSKFPSFDKKFVEYKDGKYVVAAYVESQNSFGAELKQKYTCELNYIGDNKWSLVNINFN